MPIAKEDYANFKARSYTVEAVYRQVKEGVWLAMTTPESNRAGGIPALWDVYLLEDAMAVDVLPFQYVPYGKAIKFLGKMGIVCPETRNTNYFTTMERYCKTRFQGTWYRHWCGFSATWYTPDGKWHALDLYWQPPPLM